MEQTFLMVKPDGVRRQLTGRLVQRFEDKGLWMIGAKLVRLSREQAETHYEEHRQKPFFEELVQFISSGPVFAMVWQGDHAVEVSRALIGKTDPLQAAIGTIRGDYATDKGCNVIHGSDSPGSAQVEISRFFSPSELSVPDTLTAGV